MDPSIHSSSLDKRRLIHLSRTEAKSLCAPRMAAVKFLFYIHCGCRRTMVYKSVHLPRCFLTHPLPAKRSSKIYPTHFGITFLNFQHENNGLLIISNLFLVCYSAAKISTTVITEKTTEPTTCKSIDFFILNVFSSFEALQKPFDIQ